MGIEQDRAQHEGAATTAREASKPETRGRGTRERALSRYLAAELKRTVETQPKQTPRPPRGDRSR